MKASYIFRNRRLQENLVLTPSCSLSILAPNCHLSLVSSFVSLHAPPQAPKQQDQQTTDSKTLKLGQNRDFFLYGVYLVYLVRNSCIAVSNIVGVFSFGEQKQKIK